MWESTEMMAWQLAKPQEGRLTVSKHIQNIFNKLNLQVTIEPNQTKVNFLDITMDLENASYRPYIKPNTTPLYIHSQSNHPPLNN